MNKKFKTLLTAGLITIIAGSNIVSSSALSKEVITNYKTKGAIYLFINGKKYKISLGCNSNPSENSDSSTGNNNQDNIHSSTGNDNTQHNVDVVEKPSHNNNTSNDNQVSVDSFLSFKKEVVRLVNIERSKRGLSELSFNNELCNVSTLKSQDMINKNYFGHNSPTYGSPFNMMNQFNIIYRTAGENIAKGQRTPAEVVNSWMNSPGHRANILNANFTDIGIGVAKSSNGTLYWTQMFIGK